MRTFRSPGRVVGMRSEIRTAIASGAASVSLGVIYMTLPLAFPEAPRWLWQAVLGAAALLLLVCVAILIYDYVITPLRRRRMITLVGMIVCGVGLAGFAIGHFWRASSADVSQFRGEITGTAAFDVSGQPGILYVIPVVDVRNLGGANAYITGFSLKIHFPDGFEKETDAQPVFDQQTFRGPTGWVDVTPENTLWGRDGAPSILSFRSGRLWFAFSGVQEFREMSDMATRLTLTIKDSSGASSSSTIQLGDIKGPRISSVPLTNPPAASPPSPAPPASPRKK